MYNKNLEITEWIVWHTDMINKAIEKVNFWDSTRAYSLNTCQIKAPNKRLDAGVDGFEGDLSTRKYISIPKTSIAAAKRDITDLVSKNLIEQV
ncbi:MAG: hypothetical protein LGB70_07340, partial [Sulfurovum sp.]|nr:hypothetical protein [Sulfurovum sp.]